MFTSSPLPWAHHAHCMKTCNDEIDIPLKSTRRGRFRNLLANLLSNGSAPEVGPIEIASKNTNKCFASLYASQHIQIKMIQTECRTSKTLNGTLMAAMTSTVERIRERVNRDSSGHQSRSCPPVRPVARRKRPRRRSILWLTSGLFTYERIAVVINDSSIKISSTSFNVCMTNCSISPPCTISVSRSRQLL